ARRGDNEDGKMEKPCPLIAQLAWRFDDAEQSIPPRVAKLREIEDYAGDIPCRQRRQHHAAHVSSVVVAARANPVLPGESHHLDERVPLPIFHSVDTMGDLAQFAELPLDQPHGKAIVAPSALRQRCFPHYGLRVAPRWGIPARALAQLGPLAPA